MKPFQCLFLIVVSATICFAADHSSGQTAASQKGVIHSILGQLDTVNDNLNQLQAVLNKFGSQLDHTAVAERQAVASSKTEQTGLNKLSSMSNSAHSALIEVDTVRAVVKQLTSQLASLLGTGSTGNRQRRSLPLNEPNLEQLSQLIHLFRNGPVVNAESPYQTSFSSSSSSSSNLVRRRRQANQGIISSTAQTASNGLQDLLQVATNLSNGIRRRLSTISTQLADLTANGVLTLNEAATNTVQGATSIASNLGSSVVSSVNSVTGQISSAISNGVKQANQVAQSTFG